MSRKKVVLRGGGLDEAPVAYRRLPDRIVAGGGCLLGEPAATLRAAGGCENGPAPWDAGPDVFLGSVKLGSVKVDTGAGFEPAAFRL